MRSGSRQSYGSRKAMDAGRHLEVVIARDGDGVRRRWARLSEVWSLRDRLADRILGDV